VLFLQRAPSPPLDAFISSFWYCENEPRPFALERVLPSGAAQLIVNLKEDQTRIYHPAAATTAGTVLSGISSRYTIIDTLEQECVAGIAFRPGGTVPFFPLPACELCDTDIPLEFLWGRSRAAELREQLLTARTAESRLDVLDRAMLETYTVRTLHPAVRLALETFGQYPDALRIADLADSAGLSSKRFIEHFKSSVGLPPKQYWRLLRFQHALARAERGRCVDWTRIALDCGYFDQAHFIRDFRSFAGITPTGYDSGRTEFRNHVKFVQSEAAAAMR
jgi:AraC-like DNA-binding protein